MRKRDLFTKGFRRKNKEQQGSIGKQDESEKSDLSCFFCALYYIKILNENIAEQMYTKDEQISLYKGIVLGFLDEYLYKRTIFQGFFCRNSELTNS